MSHDRAGVVVVVGGAGSMGRWAVRSLARDACIGQLVIADLDLDRARRLAQEVGGPCLAVQLDATDRTTMHEALGSCDVVLNTMGPFALHGRSVLEAALAAGCDYLDIDDDWESTLEALSLVYAARRAGSRVVKGIGGSPGSSNLLAVLASRRLDRVDEIVTGWSMWGAVVADEPAYDGTARPAAALEHWLLQCSGTIRAWRGWSEAETRPLERFELEYPGIGKVSVHSVGHPEAITLPRWCPQVRTSANVMTGPAWLFEHARKTAADFDAKRIDLREGAARLADPPRPAQPAERDPMPAVWALARGEKDGKSVAAAAHLVRMPDGKMGGNTGLPLAIGFHLLRDLDGLSPGVYAPEQVFDPLAFFDRFARALEPQEGDGPVVIEATAKWDGTPLVG